jgi:hypothetical protein
LSLCRSSFATICIIRSSLSLWIASGVIISC